MPVDIKFYARRFTSGRAGQQLNAMISGVPGRPRAVSASCSYPRLQFSRDADAPIPTRQHGRHALGMADDYDISHCRKYRAHGGI